MLSTLNSLGENRIDTEVITVQDLANDKSHLEKASIHALLPDDLILSESLMNSAIPQLKDSKIGRILSRYYERCLGGAEHWKTIKSIRISGNLDTLSGIYDYESIIKNPNQFKISISREERTNVIAFDGKDTRQTQVAPEEPSTPPITLDMDRLINETLLLNYLLFPLRKGIAFQYLGTVREFNTVCYKLRLFSEQDFVIDYFFDVESHFIVTVRVTDMLNEFSPVRIRFSNHRLVDGLIFAHKIESFINEAWDSILNVRSIDTNVGVANWMFHLKNESL